MEFSCAQLCIAQHKDVYLLKLVQRRVMMMISGLEHLSYEASVPTKNTPNHAPLFTPLSPPPLPYSWLERRIGITKGMDDLKLCQFIYALLGPVNNFTYLHVQLRSASRLVEANITPVFIRGKKEDPGNYLPVNLTSIPGKVMERVILEAVSIHMDDKKVIRRVSMDSLKVNHV
ncbi:hypothetical protein BTVI_62292 [Pitangus sulphuratus]|nr:hypothetical protein BTVI_62292 [Pitangus sulphuratus]